MAPSLDLQVADITQRLELEYGWEILIDPTGVMQRENAEQSDGWRSARVGVSWNVQFDDLRNYMGAAWYRTTFELPVFHDTRHVLLKFGAVDYFCEVYLNQVFIGTHEGGYTPFSFEVTSAVRPGPNQLVIRVVDPPMDEAQNRALFPDMMYNEIPHGKQNWYVQISGIWQGVRVELCPAIYIERLDVVPQITGEFELIAKIAGVGLTAENGALAAGVTLNSEIYDSNGRRVFESTQPLDVSNHTIRVKGIISHPRLWTLDDPSLYRVEVSLTGALEYRRRTRFGFRSFESREGRLYFNGKPFFLLAALDQDFYPETVHTPSSKESVLDMMVKAKRLGVNVLRCHLKVAHPVYLDVADEIGMLIWTELPSWSDCWFPSDHFSTMAAVRTDKMFWEILIRDWNHPCIVLQTIMNESWGINLKDVVQREWLRTTFDRVKGLLAPLGRLVVDNSPCEGNFHIKTDIEDFHQYYSMPDQVEQWDKWLAELATHPEWTFSPYGDAERSGREPLLVSEFGNWGLPKLPDELPWWLELSFGDREVTRPHGVLDRFFAYGFDTLFGSFNDLAEATQRHQFSSLKYEIESIRGYDSLSGYVITGITDVHWEANGLLDMWRNEKVYAAELSALQRPDLIMCKFRNYCFRSGERATIPTLISHFSQGSLAGARVLWSTDSGASGQFLIPDEITPGSVVGLQNIQVDMPKVERASRLRLEIEVRLKNGKRATENSYELFVFPDRLASQSCSLFVQTDVPNDLKANLERAGYQLSLLTETDSKTLIIASRYDSHVAAHLQSGGNVLLLASSGDALPSDWPLKVTPRAGTELDGRWFSNFNWIRQTEEPFSSVAFGSILGFESAGVAPHYVIQGIEPESYKTDVLSGMALGWLNKNCGLALQMRVGTGRLIVTTYRFDDCEGNLYAAHLLDSLIRYIGTGHCQPRLELPNNLAISQPS